MLPSNVTSSRDVIFGLIYIYQYPYMYPQSVAGRSICYDEPCSDVNSGDRFQQHKLARRGALWLLDWQLHRFSIIINFWWDSVAGMSRKSLLGPVYPKQYAQRRPKTTLITFVYYDTTLLSSVCCIIYT